MIALLRRCTQIPDAARCAAVLLALAVPALGGIDLDLTRPGTFGLKLHSSLGQPVGANTAEGGWNEDFAKPDAGLERITVWYDDGGFVQWARIVLVSDLKPTAAVLLFDVLGGSARGDGHAFAEGEGGHFIHYAADGVHLFVVDGRVAEVWRTKPRADVAAIKAEAGATYPARPLPEEPPDIRTEDPGLDEESIIDVSELFGEELEEDPFELDVSGAGELPDYLAGDPAVYDDKGAQEPAGGRRMLEVGPVTATLELDSEFFPVLRITGPVKAQGFLDKEIRFEGYLRSASSSQPLMAAPSAPAELRGRSDNFHPTFTDHIRFPQAEWKAATLTYPLRWVQDFDRLEGWHVISLEVVCEDMAAYASAIVDVPGLNSIPAEPPRLVQGVFTTEDAVVEPAGAGLWVYTPLQVLGARGQTVICQATLRQRGKAPVLAAPGWDDWRAPDGRFYSQGSDDVLYDDSSWKGFRIFVPFAALDLEPGSHRLVLRQQASLGGVGAAREAEIEITIPSR